LDGGVAVAGAPLALGAVPVSGAAYAYARDEGGLGHWGQIAKLAASDGAEQDRFGFVVGLSSDTVVVGAPYDGDLGTYSGSAYVYHLEYVPPRPDLVVVKTADPAVAAPGEPLTYTLIFSNTGILTATGVVLTDVVPGELRGTRYTSRGAAITPTGALSYTWLVADLAPGMGGVVTITGLLAPDLSCGQVFTNTAAITAAADITPFNNSSYASLTVRSVYSLTVEPPADADSGDPGLDVVYALAVTNTGNCIDVFDVAANHLWPTTYPATVGPLGMGEGATLNVTVSVPLGTAGGTGDVVTLALASQGESTILAGSVLSTTANQVAPVLAPIADREATVGIPLTFTATASDANGDALSFGLDAGAPEGASIDLGTGVFAWMPAGVQGGNTYTITVRVADDGVPSLDDAYAFAITVGSVVYRSYLPLARR
jgi:uncharacterized repeat protein (TIGR01451 family)